MLNRIRLDDLLGRDLTVRWFEGIAIVQGVCRRILAGDAERGFPPAEHILLCVDGTIEIVGTASPAQSVAVAGHTLSQMLGEDAPVRLRLVATQATAGGTGYQALQEFSEALAYFERPDAAAILRDLYQRASAAESRGVAPAPFVPVVEAAKSPEPEPVKQKHRSWLVVAGVAGVIVCAGVWGIALGSKGTAASAVVATVQGAVRSTLAAVAPAEPLEKHDSKSESKAATLPDKRAKRRLSPDKPRRDATGQVGRISPLREAPLPALLSFSPFPINMFKGPDVVYVIRPDGSQVPPLYSASHTDVVPPKSVYPKLPAAPPSGFSLPHQTVLEMVIGANGLVERVKLRSEPRNIHEFMLVSAAKAWQFEPARREGTPVRYLHTVVLTLQ